MQLAATQRPHPPPVPPRPSRQVVAEALKRSPRPPCPTRQAPPPPNTKPWRSDQEQPAGQQQVCAANAGRTVVYESTTKESIPKETGSETTEARVTDKDRVARNASERSEREEEEDRLRRSPQEKYRPHPEPQHPETNEPVDPRQNQVRGRDQVQTETKDHRSDSACPADRKRLDNDRLESFKPPVQPKCNASVRDEGRGSSSSDRSKSHTEKSGAEAEARPTPTRRSCLAKNRDAAVRKPAANAISSEEVSSVNENIEPASNVDRATIVVIDEPERKAASDADDVDEQNGTANENENDNIHRQDWLDAGVQYSSTQITLSGEDGDRVNGLDRCENEKIGDLNFLSLQERIAMSSLQGLPPLPRSLSGFNLSAGGRGEGCEPPPPPTRSSSKTQRGGKVAIQSSSRPSPPARQLTTLDTQLAILRREMFGLRQLDLSLLSQLWSLNESIQEFRQLLQEQEDRAPSPSPSSEEGDDTSYGTHPPPPPRRAAPVAHHHRPPRPPRPARPPPSDESPSSEEYGAV
ncbi:uncharacterized protein LOC117227182 isoform X1 [Megalopta genalis]|uniref:uncharacterized protein LOC117227182 isoform X1 n=2 Tax=Megalopta genalis TaxID=115081 RepID=UPI00144343F6|nr:serine/arginine repetitive matrix protein 1-like isoform X1 [Megalopta genalis]